MTPYYDDGQIQIWLGDCREILPMLATDSIDLVLTDPPYGMAYRSNYRAAQFQPIAGDDQTFDLSEFLPAMLRSLKMSRHLYLFGRWSMDDARVSASAELVWEKGSGGMPNGESPWLQRHEYITFAINRKRSSHKERAQRKDAPSRLRRGTVLSFPRLHPTQLRHPAEKPLPLLRELIETSSRFGETVLDPFAGVGSTLEAARLEGRKAIGIEVEEHYCEIAAKSLQQSVLPLEAT